MISTVVDIVSQKGLLVPLQALNLSFSDYASYYRSVVRQQQLLAKGTQYQTVELEKGIYYVFQNFVSVIDGFNSGTVDFYMSLGTGALDGANIQKFLILICICIGTLFITLLLVSPVSFKIRR